MPILASTFGNVLLNIRFGIFQLFRMRTNVITAFVHFCAPQSPNQTLTKTRRSFVNKMASSRALLGYKSEADK